MSYLISALDKFSNYLNTEANRKKEESMYLYNYVNKQKQAKNLIDNIDQLGLVPEGVNVEGLDPQTALQNIQSIMGLNETKERKTKEDYNFDVMKANREKEQFLQNNSLFRGEKDNIILRSVDADGNATETDVSNGKGLNPLLSTSYNALKNQIIDDKRQAENTKYTRSLQPKESNYTLKDGSRVLLKFYGGNYYTPDNQLFDATLIERKSGIGEDKSITIEQNRLYTASQKEEANRKNYSKEIVTKFSNINDKTKEFVDKFRNDKGYADYNLVAEEIKNYDAGESGDKIDLFHKDLKTKELYKGYFNAKDAANMYDLKARFNVSDKEYNSLYYYYRKSLDEKGKAEFDSMPNGKKLELLLEYKFTNKPTEKQTTDTNQPNQPKSAYDIAIGK